MGKKATWFLAIKRLVSCNPNGGHKKSRKARGRLKHGSFFRFFKEPSSIEQILGEVVDQHNVFIPTTQSQSQPQSQSQSQSQPQPQPQSQSQSRPQLQPKPQPSSSGRHVFPPPKRPTSPPRVVHHHPEVSHTPEPTLQQHHLSATRIQAVYRGYMARKNARGGLTGLVRLQKIVTSKNVKRQTVNAMKQMQLLIRVQTQIQSRRIQALKPQPNNNNSHKQMHLSEGHWDDSLISKEEREARLQRKADAVIKRDRAMAYAYSHQLSTAAAHKIPWWWKWLEHQLPYPTLKNHQFATTPSSRSTHTPMSSNARKGSSLYSMKDDDSLRSCPPFSVPHYMSPTASTRAKAARPTSNPKERCGTPGSCSDSSKRRLSFPFTPNSPRSLGDFSIGRKPFNRFV